MKHSLTKERETSSAIHRAFDELEFRHMPFDHPMVARPGEASSHGILVLLSPASKGLEFWETTSSNLLEPGISSGSLSFVDHREEILHETIGPFQGGAGLTEGNQILPLDLIERLGVTHKQPDGDVRRIFLDAMNADRSFHLSPLERLQVPVDAALGSRVALCPDFPPKHQAIALPIVPTLENKGSKGIKRAEPLAPFSRFREGAFGKPSSNGSFSQAKLASNLLWLHPLRLELHDLLIARISASTPSQAYFLHMCWLRRAPFFDTDDLLSRLALIWLFCLACRRDFCVASR